MPDNTTPVPLPQGDGQPEKKDGGVSGVPTSSTPVTPATPAAPVDEVIITPDDGPVERVRPEDATDTTPSKPKAPAPTSSVAAGLAWQGGTRPQQSDLAALRARVEHTQSAPPVTPVTPVVATAPIQEHPLEPEIVPPPTKTEPSLRSVRTFKDDMAHVITKKQVSVVSAISAEENRRAHKELTSVTTPEEGRGGALSGFWYFVLGISVTLLIVGGAGVGIALYFFKPAASVLPASEIPSYVLVEDVRSVNTDNLSKSQLLSGLIKVQQDLNTKIGSITQLYFIKTAVDSSTQKIVATLLPATDWLALLQTHIPAPLARSLDTKMMFGFYQFDQVRPFIILKTSSYETAFAGMLTWERDLNADLAPLFGPAIVQKFSHPISDEEVPITESSSTETASTSSSTGVVTPAPQPVTTTLFLPHSFQDAVIVNKDVRVLRDDEGKIALVYGFYDKQTILITTDENTFKEVVTRLSSRRY